LRYGSHSFVDDVVKLTEQRRHEPKAPNELMERSKSRQISGVSAMDQISFSVSQYIQLKNAEGDVQVMFRVGPMLQARAVFSVQSVVTIFS